MHNQSLNSKSSRENINLLSIIELVVNSKKLVLLITLVTPILVLLFDSQKEEIYHSKAIVEIGEYSDNTNQKILIEPSKKLYEELNINFIYKSGYDLTAAPSLNRLVEIKASANSYSESERIVNEAIIFVKNRHNKIISDQIAYLNEEINRQINDLTNKLFRKNEDDRNIINYELAELRTQLPYLDNKIKQLNQIIAKENDNLTLLKSSPELMKERTAVSPTLDQIIYSYWMELVELQNSKSTILLKIDTLKDTLSSNNLESEQILKLSREKENLKTQLDILNNDIYGAQLFSSMVLLKGESYILPSSTTVYTKAQQLERINALSLQLKQLSEPNLRQTKLIGEIQTIQIQLNKTLAVLISLIFGLIVSTIIILMKSSIPFQKN